MHFDEKSMFAGHKIEAKTLKVKVKSLTATHMERDESLSVCDVWRCLVLWF